MPSKKVELGHKPNVDEIKKVVRTFEKIASHNIDKYSDNLKNKLEEKELKETVIGFAMACGVSNVAKLLNKFLETGVIMNPLDENLDDENMSTDDVFDRLVGKDEDDDKMELNNMSEDDIEESFHIMDNDWKATALKICKKYGKDNAVKLLKGYCESFIHMTEDWEENECEIDIEALKENGEEVTVEEALDDLRKDGGKDVADAVEALINKVTNGEAQVKVFRCKTKKNND